MARADYRLCDVCGEKVFYDANLNYGTSEEGKVPYREAGRHQLGNATLAQKYGNTLDYLGDWAVICDDCAKTHKCVVLLREDE